MSVEESRVCDLFDEIEKHYKEFDELDAKLVKELIQEMEKFAGSEKDVDDMKKAFKRIENVDEESDEEEEEESAAATDEWSFKIAINIFKKFKVRFEIKRKVVTDPPVQGNANERPLTQVTEQPPAPESSQQAAKKRIEVVHANCVK